MDYQQTLSYLLAHPEAPVPLQWALDSLQACPAFYLPAAMLLKRNPQDADAGTLAALRAAVALRCPDRAALADYVDLAADGWDSFYPPEAPAPQKDTDRTIDDFINRYGKPSPEEDALIEQLLFNPTPPDYFPEADTPLDPSDPLALPPELAKAPAAAVTPDAPEAPSAPTTADPAPEPAAVKAAAPAPEPAGEESLLESLAKIYIKRQRYSRAFEIIGKLSLKYPEKSVYFADQLRFLQKLIVNQRYNP